MRQRSKMQDKNDWSQFRHHRDRLVGCYGSEFGQDMPAFWTADGASVAIRGQARGASAFLVLNGPSFAGMDKRPLRYAFTMSVNNGPAACYSRFLPSSWCMVDDPSRFLLSIWLNPAILKFVPHAHANKGLWTSFNGKDEPYSPNGRQMLVRECPNILYFHRNEAFEAARYWVEDTVNWGNHTERTCAHGHKGGRSVMLAALKILYTLGYRRIFLLGADFKMDENHRYSFEEDRRRGAIKCNNATYAALNDRLKAARPFAEELGLKIWNCTPDSGLTAFESMPYEDALKLAFDWAGGDYRALYDGREKTLGMYQDPKEKMKAWEERQKSSLPASPSA